MKRIEAVIAPYMLEAVKNALLEIGIAGMTVSDVMGSGRHARHARVYRGGELVRDTAPRCKVEVVVGDDSSEKVCLALIQACEAECVGDESVSQAPVAEAIRIRTSEVGDAAITF